jgi:hypothetical protein
MTLADPKPLKRVTDPTVFETFHSREPSCVCCGWRFADAHHILKRSQGGDDVLSNLIGLCTLCHRALHDRVTVIGDFGRKVTPAVVDSAIAGYIRSEAGSDCRTYLRGKLGDFAAEAFVQNLEGNPRF